MMEEEPMEEEMMEGDDGGGDEGGGDDGRRGCRRRRVVGRRSGRLRKYASPCCLVSHNYSKFLDVVKLTACRLTSHTGS